MTQKFLSIAMAASLAAMLGSCSILNKSTTVTGDSGSASATATETTTYSAESPSASSSASATVPTPSTLASKEYVQAVQTSPLAGKLSGEWTIVEAGKYHIEQDEEMPYVYFDESVGRFYASNGCNVLNGDYTPDALSQIAFSNVITTMADCPDIKYTSAINSALRDGATLKVKIEEQNKATVATLSSKSGTKMLTLRRHNTEELNGKWIVAQIGDTYLSGDEVNLFLDIAELSIHGNTGCNYFNGEISLEPEDAHAISFSQMGVTMKLCPNADIERALLVALEQTSAYSLSGSTLKFLNSSGKTIVILKRE